MSEADSSDSYLNWLDRLRGRQSSEFTPSNRPMKSTHFEVDSSDDLNGYGLAAPVLVSDGTPQSPAAEQYRLLAARIEGLRVRCELRHVAITSAMANEGKTVTAINLAYVLAKDFGRRVLLIDADFKKPSIWRYVGREPGPGLSDLIANRKAPEAVVRPFRHEQLSVLEAGLAKLNPTRVWKSPLIREVFAHFGRDYEYLVVDTPPVLAVVDTTLIADVVDGVVVVARAGQTPRAALQKAVASLPKAKVLGVVLNGLKAPPHTYYHHPYP